MDAALKVKISAETGELLDGMKKAGKSLQDFKDQADRFREALSKAIDPASIIRLNKALEASQAKIKAITTAGLSAGGGLDKVKTGSERAGAALTDLSRIASDAPFGFIAIQNNISPIIESFGRLKTETGSVKGALSAMASGLIGPAGLGVAVALATGVLTILSQKGFFDTKEAIDKTKESADKFKEAVNGIFSTAAKEATEVISLIAVLNSEVATRERKLSAIKELNRINPEVFGGLQLEGGLVKGLDSAYQSYIANLKTVIAVKIKQQQLEKITDDILKKEGITLLGNEKIAFEGTKRLTEELSKREKSTGIAGAATNRLSKSQQELNKLYAEQGGLIDDIGKLQAGVDVHTETAHAAKVKKVKEHITWQQKLHEIIMSNWRAEATLTAPTGTPTPGVSGSSIPGAGITTRDFGLENGLGFESIITKQQEMAANQAAYNEALAQTTAIASTLEPVFQSVFDALASGGNVFDAVGDAIKRILIQLAAATIQAAVFGAILNVISGGSASAFSVANFQSFKAFGKLIPHAEGGVFTKPTRIGGHLFGEAGPEALVPLNRSNEFLDKIGGGSKVEVFGEFELRNDRLVAAVKKGTNQFNRSF